MDGDDRQSIFDSGGNITLTAGWAEMKLCTDIHGTQRCHNGSYQNDSQGWVQKRQFIVDYNSQYKMLDKLSWAGEEEWQTAVAR